MSTPTEDRVAGWVVDQQLQSPLFTRLPPEIRIAIFKLALAPHCENPVAHDFRLRHDHADSHADGALSESIESAQFTDGGSGEDSEDGELDSGSESCSGSGGDEEGESRLFLSWELDEEESDDGSFEGNSYHAAISWKPHLFEWTRPDTIGVEKLSMAFLRTCRLIYIEASHGRIIPDHKFRIWPDENHPALRNEMMNRFRDDETMDIAFPEFKTSAVEFYKDLTADQRNCVLAGRMFMKGGGFAMMDLVTISRSYLFRRIEYLRITLSDPNLYPSFHDPFGPIGLNDLAASNFRQTSDFGRGPPPPETPDTDWVPPLIIDFDCREESRADMATRAEWAARVWRFPLWSPRPDGCTYLSAAGNPIGKTSWRGGVGRFSTCCPVCSSAFKTSAGFTPIPPVPTCVCSYGDERALLIDKGLGPRIYTWTLTWTPRVGRPWVVPYGEYEERKSPPDGRWMWEEGDNAELREV